MLKMYRVVLWGLLVVLSAPAYAIETESRPLPALNLRTRDGQAFRLESLNGKVVVLDFWAPWCVPCRASFPRLDALQGKYGSRGLQVVGLTLQDDPDAIYAFLSAVPVRFPVVIDSAGTSGTAFQVVAMPTTLLLDRGGQVVARFEGGSQKVHEKLEAAIDTLLSGGSLEPSTGFRVSLGLEATGKIKAWQRGYLADPIMSLDGGPLMQALREYIHASKEAAAGDGGASGGGCGCN
jgi:cytochrome c biogenesis protein CcmG, thiol:disulfide interchange protein DsbE